MEPKKIVVIGGTAAGPKAAAKARRLDAKAEITIIQKDPDFSMAACGYPYYVGGVFNDRNELLTSPIGVVRDSAFFKNAKGIEALPLTEATDIDREGHTVTCRNLSTGETFEREYDKLIIATGASPRIPPLPGADLEGITTLQSMADTDYLRKIRDDKEITRAVILGGGLIGVEAAEALRQSGMEVTVVEMLPQVLRFLDWQLAKLVENHMKAKGVRVVTDMKLVEFLGESGRLTGVRLESGEEIACGVAVVATGVKPNAQLAEKAGLHTGALGGIQVNDHLQTSDPDIYAVGDCIEVRHLLTGKPTYAPLGDLANLQGRVAAQNAVLGDSATFPGTLQTSICKVFDFSAAASGLSERQAVEAGIRVVTVLTANPDKPHYMAAAPVILKMVAESGSGKVLGVQAVGLGNVAKEVAVGATAIQAGMTVQDMLNLDLPYAPPYSPPFSPIITAAHVLENKMLGRMEGISAVEVREKLDRNEDFLLLDMRSPAEYEEMRLGVGEKLIPLGALRKRIDEIPQDKDTEIVVYCKISLRGYEAATFLTGNGWKNVKVMEGGVVAWPYPREK